MSIQDENISQARAVIDKGDEVVSVLREVSDMTDSPYVFSADLIRMTMETVAGDDSPIYDHVLRRVIALLEVDNQLLEAPAVETSQPFTLAMTKQYVYLEKKLQRDLLDTDVLPSEFEATTKAGLVALHYLAEQSDYLEFSAALKLARSARDVIRDQFPLTVR